MLINELLTSKKLNESDIIINEFTVDKSSRRVDLALISKNFFEAFEIKSEADSLKRIEGQVEKYLEYFDKVTVISAKKHSKQLQKKLPSNVGLWVISGRNFKKIKRGNKKILTNKKKIIDLMNVSELKQLANSLKLNTKNLKRSELEGLLEKEPAYILREACLSSLKKRYGPVYSMFKQEIFNKNVSTEDLRILKQYARKEKILNQEPSIENLRLCIDSFSL